MNIYRQNYINNGFSRSQQKIIEIVKVFDKKLPILELGSSTGYMTQIFQKIGFEVDVVENNIAAAKVSSQYSRKTFVGSVEDSLVWQKIRGKYQLIIAADILEHLKNPEICLKYVIKKLNKGGKLIVSLPNIASWRIRKDLFFKGKFEYQDIGILDKTHLRFYTLYSAEALLSEQGLDTEEKFYYEIDYPLRDTIIKILGGFLTERLDNIIVGLYPNLAAGHLVMVSYPK